MKLFYEVQCARCTRKEMKAAAESDLTRPEEPEIMRFQAHLAGHAQVKFSDLCAPCIRAVSALLQQIGKKIDGMSPDRKPTDKADKAKKQLKEQPAAQAGHPVA